MPAFTTFNDKEVNNYGEIYDVLFLSILSKLVSIELLFVIKTNSSEKEDEKRQILVKE